MTAPARNAGRHQMEAPRFLSEAPKPNRFNRSAYRLVSSGKAKKRQRFSRGSPVTDVYRLMLGLLTPSWVSDIHPAYRLPESH